MTILGCIVVQTEDDPDGGGIEAPYPQLLRQGRFDGIPGLYVVRRHCRRNIEEISFGFGFAGLRHAGSNGPGFCGKGQRSGNARCFIDGYCQFLQHGGFIFGCLGSFILCGCLWCRLCLLRLCRCRELFFIRGLDCGFLCNGTAQGLQGFPRLLHEIPFGILL